MTDANAMDIDPSVAQNSGPIVAEATISVTQNTDSSSGQVAESVVAMEVDNVASSSSSGARAPLPHQVIPLSNGQPFSRSSNAHLTYFSLGSGEEDSTEAPEPRIVRTGYVYNPLMMLHCQDGYIPTPDDVIDSGEGHPEEPMRIKRIFTRLKDQGLIRRMKQIEDKEVTIDQVGLVHGPEHWYKVQGTEVFDDKYIQDTKAHYESLSLYVCRETARCARLSCGGVIQACQSVCTGEVRNAFAIVRPPGHHAEPDEHMGFCFYNNVAVAAREMQRQGLAKKVLILDWDVHHGNGTQRAFWQDDSVLYMSIHRHDGGKFYPSTDFGALDMVGEGPGEGKSVNIPWPSGGFGDGDYIYAFQRIIMPIAYEFNPDLVIISAGFDAAEGDQLGMCKVTPAGYGHMTHMLCALAGGKVVVALEGGYNLKAISDSSLAVAQVLLGETPAELGPVQASEVATELMYDVAKVQSKYWKSIDTKACEPPEVGSRDTEYVQSVPDLLKAYRTKHMYEKFGLLPLPLANQELDEAYHDQVLVSEGVYGGDSDTLVLFVHDFGNLRVETEGNGTTDVKATSSYLIDTTDAVVRWVQERNYSLVDVNVLRQLRTAFLRDGPRMVSKSGDKQDSQLMLYIWDNLIELSSARNVILIGHGSGCGAIMELVNRREVQDRVKAVVQVAGLHSLVRVDPTNESRRTWFSKNNRTYVPEIHPLLGEVQLHRRLGGQINTSSKAKVVDVLVDVLPQIKEFVDSKVVTVAPSTNGHTAPEVTAVA